MTLYRKHRPQKFTDIIGQEHIVQTITNALQEGRFSHAYLFSGPRGLGKTSLARLLAKALNCQGRDLAKSSFEPCNKCISCKEIALGNNLDMIEIDAASNRGIDEIRDLREKIRFAPTATKFKIYIIDECHMLTKEAFNALLKTLEEPPKHAIFVLATTELHKVPATILSRTQSFEFRKASFENILKLLTKTVKTENIKIDDEALKLIARLSFGAFRDALSMLDQVSSLQTDGRHRISLEEVQKVLGQTTEEMVWKFAEYLAIKNRQQSLNLIEKIYYEGKDLENFIAEVIILLRQVLLKKEGIIKEFEYSKDENQKLEHIAENLEINDIIFIIEKFSEVVSKVKTSILGQLPLEIAVYEINEKLENNNKNLNKIAKIELVEEVSKDNVSSFAIEMKTPISEPVAKKDSLGLVKIDANIWQEVVREVKKHNNTIAAMLKSTMFAKTTDGHIILAVKFKFHAEQICMKKNLAVIEAAVLKVTNKAYKVDCIVDPKIDLKKPLDDEEILLNNAKEVFEIE